MPRSFLILTLIAMSTLSPQALRGEDTPPLRFHVHRLVVHEDRDAFGHGSYTSGEIAAAFPFNEVIPSFNVDVPEDTGFVVWLRLRPTGAADWTPWYYFGTFGDAPRPDAPHVRDAQGRVSVDIFKSKRTFDHMQYRVQLWSKRDADAPRIVRFALCYSNTTGDESLWKRFAPQPASRDAKRAVPRLAVPFRSQKAEAAAIAGRICSPTSVGMVLAYRGIDVPTHKVAALAFDPEHDIYGNWARAIQTAFRLGVPGVVRRFHSLDEAAAVLADGQPLILSIRAAKGDLPGAPYPQTAGHLLVLTGFDQAGNPLVNDPAAKTATQGQITYPRAAIEKVWLGHGGVAYVLRRRR